jgi:hypothetical protein
MSSKSWFDPVKGYSLLDQMTGGESEHIHCGVCECPVNLMLGPVIRTLLLDRMSIQLQFTLGKNCASPLVDSCEGILLMVRCT